MITTTDPTITAMSIAKINKGQTNKKESVLVNGAITTTAGGHDLDKTVANTTSSRSSKIRSLTLNDLIIGEFIAAGSVNVAFQVKFPSWWNGDHCTNQTYTLKLTTSLRYALAEVRTLEALNANATAARQNNIVPLIFSLVNVTNPFYSHGSLQTTNEQQQQEHHVRELPPSFPESESYLLTLEPQISAIIIPFYQQRNSISDLNTLKKARLFTRSLLQQLDYAHGLGRNVNDLGEGNTWIVDADDTSNSSTHVILPDWNDARVIGETIRPPEASNTYYWRMTITPPETMFGEGIPPDGRPVRVTSISAFDIWSVGVLLSDIMYRPCYWSYTYSRSTYRKEIFRAVGGDTRIPVSNETDMVDVAPLVGLDSKKLLKSKFRPPLFVTDVNEMIVKCNERSFPMLRDEKKEGRGGEAIDFLQSIFKISPLDRPTAEMLLRHPFLH
eukprot:CAMPEP_0198293828 /NCGR_PEP_ID=MMETSP1449-20131203/19045_1 /TAXON_ID=420275 /ORGANISM="Attheya septentrionalis, Strain CCMP2084" /LENGTH=442 /DNA_ID=CAMNT_0043993563 /DNA_START=534 /DNA_END=1862 /DNA_ORIENTATION=-